MTHRVPGLVDMVSEERVEINPVDAEALGVASGDDVKVTSRRGQVEARAEVTAKVPPGVIFMTFHFPQAAANFVTNTALDPVAKIPEVKVCAVKVERLARALAGVGYAAEGRRV